jgi:hypothetical protein
MRKKFGLFENDEYFDAGEDEMFNLVDSDRPIVLENDDILENESTDAKVHVNIQSVSAKDFEKEKYGWRYPNLFDQIQRTNGEPIEDFAMAAVRLIELDRFMSLNSDNSELISIIDTSMRSAMTEARLFLENEQMNNMNA